MMMLAEERLPDVQASAFRPRVTVFPSSIRGRLTLLVGFLAMLLLIPTGLVAGAVAHRSIMNTIWLDARHEAGLVAAAYRSGHPGGPPIRSDVPGIDLVQVVAPGHHVIAASPAARGLAPMTTVWPGPRAPEEDVSSCSGHGVGCVRVAALRVGPSADSPVVYAGRRAPLEASTGLIDSIFTAQIALLVALAVAATWKVTGRTLRPVESIRGELATMNVNDLSGRVPQPSGDDEIARLARTINGTLSRLEGAKAKMERALNRQRQFAADASHELRTPLAGLRANLEEAQLHPDDTDLGELLRHTLKNVDRLQAIISDLLLLESICAGHGRPRERADLSAIVRSEVTRHARRLDMRLTLPSEVHVEGVREHISRVVANLLDNAERHARRSVSVEVRYDTTHAELLVDDDGGGIAPADRERVFERFTRLDTARSRDRGGTGLGLAIARDIVLAHDGSIEVGASPEGGARFLVRLPLAGGSGPPAERDDGDPGPDAWTFRAGP
ncbi:HAMP domain-containing sensor histidine kinase [Sphaerisporangium sp. NPDC051011]|uniref:sensor histidine kinase n=1 Tax=Sphaerisporangium sp. NPDC051011 TaxID=3155792 RepID=UPI0033EDBE54